MPIIGDKTICKDAITLYDKLEAEAISPSWNSLTFCSAFLSSSAAERIIQLLKQIKPKNKLKVTFIIGVKNTFTSPEAIRLLLEYINKSNILGSPLVEGTI